MIRGKHFQLAARRILTLFAIVAAVACGQPVNDEEDAERAYLGLDASLERILSLGFAGFNAAQSANIPEQSAGGDVNGTMTVNGQVDQGSSDNKGMRLSVVLDEFADAHPEEGVEILYSTETALDADLQLKDIPTGTLTGTLTGTVEMDGDLDGELTLSLSVSGALQDDEGEVIREDGTTSITGTATSPSGEFEVDVTR